MKNAIPIVIIMLLLVAPATRPAVTDPLDEGPYPVGVTTTMFVDDSRTDSFTKKPRTLVTEYLVSCRRCCQDDAEEQIHRFPARRSYAGVASVLCAAPQEDNRGDRQGLLDEVGTRRAGADRKVSAHRLFTRQWRQSVPEHLLVRLRCLAWLYRRFGGPHRQCGAYHPEGPTRSLSSRRPGDLRGGPAKGRQFSAGSDGDVERRRRQGRSTVQGSNRLLPAVRRRDVLRLNDGGARWRSRPPVQIGDRDVRRLSSAHEPNTRRSGRSEPRTGRSARPATPSSAATTRSRKAPRFYWS